MATTKEMNACRNCPRPEDINNPDAPEYFSWMKAINFNVTKAKKLVAGLPEKRFGHMTRKQIEQFGFTLATEPDDSGYISLGFYYHNDAHLAHIPADAIEAPVILATVEYTNKDKRDNLRALRAARRKLERLYAVKVGPVILKAIDRAIEQEQAKSDVITSHVLIDGSHRCVRKYREGAESVNCCILTASESQSVVEQIRAGALGFYPATKRAKK